MSINSLRKVERAAAVLVILLAFQVGCSKNSVNESVNHAPEIPALVEPQNAASVRSLAPELHWSCLDPDGNTLTYDVYFGTGSVLPRVSTAQRLQMYIPANLDYGTQYNWRILAKDDRGDSTSSPLWTFTTYGEAPLLQISTNNLNFGTDIDSLKFRIRDGGAIKLTWNLTTDQDWLTFSPTSGNSTSEEDTIHVAVDRSQASSSLGLGDNVGYVVVESNGGLDTVTVLMITN